MQTDIFVQVLILVLSDGVGGSSDVHGIHRGLLACELEEGGHPLDLVVPRLLLCAPGYLCPCGTRSATPLTCMVTQQDHVPQHHHVTQHVQVIQ